MFDLAGAIKNKHGKDIKNYPCDNNRASNLGHACTRYLVYSRLNWQEKILPEVEKIQLFRLGKTLEDQARRDIDGSEIDGQIVRIVETEVMYEYKEKERILCRGKIDGKLEVGRERYPIEIKSMQGYQWAKMDSAEDFLYADKFWLRKYLAQLTMYLLMTNSQYGMLFLVNKANGQYKNIWVELNYEFAETIVKQAQKVNEFVDKKEYPERIEYTNDVCGRCDFSHLCLPDVKNAPGMQIIDNEELEKDLVRREELKPLKSEYDKLDKQVKEIVEGKNNLIVGDYMITSKLISKTIPAKEETKQEYFTYKFININKDKIKENVRKDLTI